MIAVLHPSFTGFDGHQPVDKNHWPVGLYQTVKHFPTFFLKLKVGKKSRTTRSCYVPKMGSGVWDDRHALAWSIEKAHVLLQNLAASHWKLVQDACTGSLKRCRSRRPLGYQNFKLLCLPTQKVGTNNKPKGKYSCTVGPFRMDPKAKITPVLLKFLVRD